MNDLRVTDPQNSDWAKTHILKLDAGPKIRMTVSVMFGLAFGSFGLASFFVPTLIEQGGKWIGYIFLPIGLAGWLFAGLGLFNQRQRIRAYREGVQTDGIIEKLGTDGSAENDQHPLTIEWSFSVDGKKHYGCVSTWDHRWMRRAIPGTVVTVLYLRENPDFSVVILPDLPTEKASSVAWFRKI